MEAIPFAHINPIFQRVEEIGKMENLNATERRHYEYDLKLYRDQFSAMKFAQKAGFQTGLTEGRAKGLAQGRAEGLAEGLAEGRREGENEGMQKAFMEMARKLKKMGTDPNSIIALTGLSEDIVLSL